MKRPLADRTTGRSCYLCGAGPAQPIAPGGEPPVCFSCNSDLTRSSYLRDLVMAIFTRPPGNSVSDPGPTAS